MRRQCNELYRKLTAIGPRRSAGVLRPNAIARFAAAVVVSWLSLTWEVSQPRAQIVSSPRELAVIRIIVLDLLVH